MTAAVRQEESRGRTTHAVADCLALERDVKKLARVGLLLADLDDGNAALESLLERLVVVLEREARTLGQSWASCRRCLRLRRASRRAAVADLPGRQEIAAGDEIKRVVNRRLDHGCSKG